MQLFYTTNIEGNIITLDENDSKHATKVLRLNQGDVVNIVDGKGSWFECEIALSHPKKTECHIIKKVSVANLPYKLHVAIAPTKNIDRLEWFLEKSTEIGISEITPILCDHSERKVIKQERLERIVISAMKQSLKAEKPVLNNLVKFKEFIAQEFTGVKLMAHCEEGEKTNISTLNKEQTVVNILIGPEGDFSPKEIELAREKGFTPLSLGPSRLRTETAGVFAVSIVYNVFQEF